MRLTPLVLCGVMLATLGGCELREIRSKTRVGPEWLDYGISRTHATRWWVQQGIEFKWDRGVDTGVVYRRRDVDNGNGSNDQAVFLEFGFPLWRAKPAPSPRPQEAPAADLPANAEAGPKAEGDLH